MADTPEPSQLHEARENSRFMSKKLLVMALVMFGFGFALVPFYEKICQITGINFLTRKDASVEALVKNSQIDTSRLVTVEFDANSRGPWTFKPKMNSLQVHPGELTTIVYDITNNQARAMTGQSIPSYAPGQAAPYFKKLECFCFQQQALPGLQTRSFPVVFVLDPKLPKDVNTITLSYTFFEVPGSRAAALLGQSSNAIN